MYHLSAPAKNGYYAALFSHEAIRREAANLLGVSIADMVEVKVVEGGRDVTYCYAPHVTPGQDGAYAMRYWKGE